MTRQQIRKALSGGVIILCVVLLSVPMTHGQSVQAVRQKFTISGSVGLPGVTMQGLPGAPTTDDNGVYTAQVDYGWNGTVSPVKRGWTFEPAQQVYQKITSNRTDENYTATPVTFTIAGSVGLPGVRMVGLPNDPMTDPSGRYKATVNYGWEGSVTPTKEGYRFDTPSTIYNGVTRDYLKADYTFTEVTYVISGSVGAAGVTLKGFPTKVVSGSDYTYRAVVPYGWKGEVTPEKEGHSFLPQSLMYPEVASDQPDQNYTANVFTFQISGTTNMAGVILKGLPGEPITDNNGYYSALVPYGWSDTVTPEAIGYTFTPPSQTYTKVTADIDRQDYNPEVIKLTISGRVGTSGVTMEGLPGNIVSDASGRYSAKVEYGWSDAVTPRKDGFTFDPPSQVFAPVTADRIDQNFEAEAITYTISGNVGLAGVILEGLPGRVVSNPDGSYSATVNYNWSGAVTPKKPGYTFEPSSKEYSALMFSQASEDYQARILQFVISGQIRDADGPAAEVFVLADNDGGSATTDAEGKFEILVNYGWKGKVTPQSDKYTFTPAVRALMNPTAQDIANVNFIGQIRMLSITNAVMAGDVPFQGVTVTAQPGNYGAITDAQGKYTIRVPYGWTGSLTFEKEGFNFEAVNENYENLTADVDKTSPAPRAATSTAPRETTTTTPRETTAPVTRPSQPVTRPSQPVTQSSPQPSVPATQEQTPVDSERAQLMAQMEQLQNRVDQLTQGGGDAAPSLGDAFPDELPMNQSNANATRSPLSLDLIDVLTQLSAQSGAQIAIDATVKSQPVTIGFDPTGMPVSMVLQKILAQTDYTFKPVGENMFLVFLPITNLFQGQDLREALQDVAMMAAVTIVTDPNVTGDVWADVRGVPLETALDIMLAGSPFIVKTTPDYYLVADRSAANPAFADITQTRSVWLNYITPANAMAHLPESFTPYVKGDNDPNSRIVSVTAPPQMVDRIVADLKRLDMRPRHVLLDARVVVMERDDLLDVGVEWGFPSISAGTFGTSFDTEGGKWPWGVQIGYTGDQTFTDSLLLALNLLQKNGQAEIVSNPQVLAQDGKVASLGVMTEEYYMLTPPANNNAVFYSTTEMVEIKSGTRLVITPRIADNNDITLEMAAEVSDSIPAAASTDLPVVTRRTAKNVVTVKDGGTVALAGLTENRSMRTDQKVPGLSNLPLVGGLFKNKNNQSKTREIAVFVTAHLVRDTGNMTTPARPQRQPLAPNYGAPSQPQYQQAPAGNNFQDGLRQSLTNPAR